MLQQLSLGQKVRRPKTPRAVQMEEKIYNIVYSFENYEDKLDYLSSIRHNLRF